MANLSSSHEMWNGDTAPALPPAGYLALFPLNGRWNTMAPDGTVTPFAISLAYVSLIFFGEVVLNQIFDRYQPTVPTSIMGVELSAQEAPVGAALNVTLVDGAGTSLGGVAVLADGATQQRTVFGAPIAIAKDGIVRAKITQVGSGTAGAWLHLRLILQP